MKAIRIILLVFVTITVSGQGEIAFNNRSLRGSQFDAYVTLPDGSRADSRFTAGLYLVESTGLTLLGTTPFRGSTPTAVGAGLIVPTGFTVPGVLGGGFATFRARVWEAAAGSYEAAVAFGRLHGEFPTVSGDGTIVAGPLGGPGPTPTAYTEGFLPFTLVPEPSVTTLLVVMGALLALTKNKNSASKRCTLVL